MTGRDDVTENVLTFEALDAKHGDGLVVRWGAPGDLRTALIDGGPAGTWRGTLRPHLAALAGHAGPVRLALVAVSHIDADHIDGVLRLLYELQEAKSDQLDPPFVIERFWHNALEDLVTGGAQPSRSLAVRIRTELATQGEGVVVGQSVAQGREARQLARFLQLSLNPPIGKVLASGDRVDVEGLQLTVVGPRQSELEAQWEKWKKATERDDARAAAAAYTDRNVYNLASLVLLAEYEGRRMLLTGDARGDHVLAGLAELGLLDGDGRLHVDLFKVPHHGSAANAEPGLFTSITADHYVISANGRHGHPEKDVLDWIIDSRHGEEFTLHLTNAVTDPYDVVEYLAARGPGQRFRVNVRSPDQRGLRIALRE